MSNVLPLLLFLLCLGMERGWGLVHGTGTGPGHDFGSLGPALSGRCCLQSSACSSCLLVLCCAHFLKIFIGFHLSDCQSVIGHPPVTSR